jgi:murein DD-endopeptidase MepM/ murein hydrolase activator NlpD
MRLTLMFFIVICSHLVMAQMPAASDTVFSQESPSKESPSKESPSKESPSKMESKMVQGGFYLGQVKAGSTVIYKKKPLKVSREGLFIIGFGRDATLNQSFSVLTPGEAKKTISLSLKKRQYKIQKIKGVAKKYVSPSEKVMGRISEDNRLVKAARQYNSSFRDFFTGFTRPAQGPVSGVYGSQRFFNGEPRRPHFGLDIAGPEGAPVIAPASGVVRMAEPDLYFSGGTIVIDHGFGITTSYLHLSRVSVSNGQAIKRGDIIGEIGATGRVTGPHLDWRANWFDVRLDPALMMSN